MHTLPRAATAATTEDRGQPADAIASAARGLRPAPYRVVHRRLRALMFGTLQRCEALDPAVIDERALLVDDVERLLAACADHLACEFRHLHEPLRACAPRAVMPFHDDHLGHAETIGRLRLLLQLLRGAEPDAARALGRELLLRLTAFVGENLEHMAEEESVMTHALWAHFSDAELGALVGALHAALALRPAPGA